MDLQKYITKNKKENKSMFLFSSDFSGERA